VFVHFPLLTRLSRANFFLAKYLKLFLPIFSHVPARHRSYHSTSVFSGVKEIISPSGGPVYSVNSGSVASPTIGKPCTYCH